MEDESRLYASTKQVNQFFRRFNGEEDEKGNRYYPRDKNYRSAKLRKKYLGILFDASNSGIKDDMKVQFAKAVLEKDACRLYWTFTVRTGLPRCRPVFTYNGKDQTVTLVYGTRARPWR